MRMHGCGVANGCWLPRSPRLGWPFSNEPAACGAIAVTGLLKSRTERPSQLYLMEPYDPDREPLLLVHGLLSTPLGWAAVTNELWADPAVRGRYQIWHYHYPTSAPVLYSASLFRQHIDDVRNMLRAQGHSEIRPMTIVAHSMGGLLTKTLITDSGSKIWDTVMSVPPSRLRASEADLAMVTNILEWKASPHVRRVIFISVPHRGSQMSLSIVGRIGDALTGIPSEFKELSTRLTRDNPGEHRARTPEHARKGKVEQHRHALTLTPHFAHPGCLTRDPGSSCAFNHWEPGQTRAGRSQFRRRCAVHEQPLAGRAI